MTWHQCKSIARWHRFAIRRRSWEQGVAYRHAQWEPRFMDKFSPDYGKVSSDWIHLSMKMPVAERLRAEGKNNDANRRDFAICDADDWCLADYDTMVESDRYPYPAAYYLAKWNYTVRREGWSEGWYLGFRQCGPTGKTQPEGHYYMEDLVRFERSTGRMEELVDDDQHYWVDGKPRYRDDWMVCE